MVLREVQRIWSLWGVAVNRSVVRRDVVGEE